MTENEIVSYNRIMNEEKLLELLKQHFPTREDHHALMQEMRSSFLEMREHFKQVDGKLDDLQASSRALDKILEQHPIPRIERIEKHIGLPQYIPMGVEN